MGILALFILFVCVCDEQGKRSDRYVNLQPSLTNISSNMVATGLRFQKVGCVIHLQIQEGLLGPNGQITSVNWVPIKPYGIYDKRVSLGVDFHTLTFDNRQIDLDDLETTEPNELLTGVRFQMLGSHLNFHIRLTSFNYTIGKLNPEKSYWKNNYNTIISINNPRKKIEVNNKRVPILGALNLPDSKNNTFLDFTYSSLKEDVGQTTVPFFDSQDVVSDLPVPLSGAGIYHKGSENFAGFVAPKIITFKYYEMLDIVFNKIEPPFEYSKWVEGEDEIPK